MVRGKEVPLRPSARKPLMDPKGRQLLPASSFRGVLRSTAERILRSFEDPQNHPNVDLACIPYENKETDREYNQLCLACQLFGSTSHAGLLTINDAPATRLATTVRSHIAVDRLSGGVGEGPFFDELVSDGAGLVKLITINNFALWQLGLLGLALREIHLGYANLGAGTRKGQGKFTIAFNKAEIIYADKFYRDRVGRGGTGVVSAQPEQGHGEDQALFAAELEAVPNWDKSWQTIGLSRLELQGQDTKHLERLFGECVAGPWRELMTSALQERAEQLAQLAQPTQVAAEQPAVEVTDAQ